jgi:hypothetical protein
MSHSPFARRLPSQGTPTCRRRSSRVEAAIPIFLSGRDALGQTFRELTETTTVNLHGARLKTRNRILVGMQVTVENPTSGKAEKAICVRTEEPEPGESLHFIAIQLIHPCNLWQIENPPEDWARVQAELIDGVPTPPHGARNVAVVGTIRQPAPAPSPQVDPQQLAVDVERRSAAVVESLIANLRRQSEETVMEAFQQIEERLENAAARLETRLTEHGEQALNEFKSSVDGCRAEAAAEISRQSSEAFERHVEAALAAAESRMTNQAARVSSELASALETYRVETMGEIVREALQSFEERMQGVVSGGETRMAEASRRVLDDLDRALDAFRVDMADEFAAQKREVVQLTEHALRAKVATMLSSILGQSAPAETDADRAASKK